MKKIIIVVAALLGAFIWTGCQREELIDDSFNPEVSVKADSVWTISLKAMKGSPTTKAISIGDGQTEYETTDLESVWGWDDVVKVYLGTTCIGTLLAAPDPSDSHYAVLSGTVTARDIIAGTTRLSFICPSETLDYTGQTGRFNVLSNFTYTMAQDVLVTDTFASNIGTETAYFIPLQSIYRMSFRFQKGGEGAKTGISAKMVTVSGANGHLVQNQGMFDASLTEGDIIIEMDSGTLDPVFVALRNGDETNAEVFTFTVVDGDGASYRGTKTIPAGYKANGSFVSMKNATLTSRMEMPLSATTVDTVL